MQCFVYLTICFGFVSMCYHLPICCWHLDVLFYFIINIQSKIGHLKLECVQCGKIIFKDNKDIQDMLAPFSMTFLKAFTRFFFSAHTVCEGQWWFVPGPCVFGPGFPSIPAVCVTWSLSPGAPPQHCSTPRSSGSRSSTWVFGKPCRHTWTSRQGTNLEIMY